jgi:hypothetical protein
MSTQKKQENKNEQKNALIKENALLKAKIAYSIGSLETVNYLLKSSSPDIFEKNLEHLRSTVGRVLVDLKKGT